MSLRYLSGKLFAKMFRGGAARLHSKAEDVNQLNVFPVPDGDTGDNMSMTMDGGVDAIRSDEGGDSLASISKKVARGMLHGARGNSGVILSQFFAGIASSFEGCDKADVKTVGRALEIGVKKAYSAVLTPTEGTILTVIREAVRYAVSRIDDESSIETLFHDLLSEMGNSLRRTPELLDVLREAGVVDSGGAGLLYIMEGFNQILDGVVPDGMDQYNMARSADASPDLSLFGEDTELTYGYCTELLLRLQPKKTDLVPFSEESLNAFLQSVGDSAVCFRDGSIVKLHVHTKDPEKVLSFCHDFGEFLTVKIENMTLQHHEASAGTPVKRTARQRYGTVAVASGAGIQALFKSLGADYVINGGQTMNPSSEDFLDAFDEVNAEVIFVLPNNSNVILAARQAAEICEYSRVYVLESRTLGDGYAALSNLNYEPDDPQQVVDEMNRAMEDVTTCLVSTAVRDATFNSVKVREGDYIGFTGKTILAADRDRLTVVRSLLDGMDLTGKYALTVFSGRDADPETDRLLQKYVEENWPDLTLYPVDGGQTVYDYILVAE